MTIGCTRDFSQPVDGALKWRDNQGATIDHCARQGIGYAKRAEMPLFFEHIERIDEHKAGEESPRVGQKHAAAELRKCVMLAVGRDNVMGRLRYTVIAHNGMHGELSAQVISDGT